MPKLLLRQGLRPAPRWGSLQLSPTPNWIRRGAPREEGGKGIKEGKRKEGKGWKGKGGKGKERRGKGKEGREEKKDREGERTRGEGSNEPPLKILDPPLRRPKGAGADTAPLNAPLFYVTDARRNHITSVYTDTMSLCYVTHLH